MSLRIIVCVKTIIQIMDTDSKKKTLTKARQRLSGSINSPDMEALMHAVTVKSYFNDASVTVISMGPSSTKDILQSLYAYGVDQVILLSDSVFAGADTLATANVLARAIQKLNPFDIVFCGKISEDGGTSQVGPEIAELLNIPHVADIKNCEWGPRSVICERNFCMKKQKIEMNYPCLVIMDKQNTPLLSPTLQDIVDNMDQVIAIWNHKDIGISPENCGKRGSATKVSKLYFDHSMKKGKQIVQGKAQDLAQSFLEFLREVKEKHDHGHVGNILQTHADTKTQSILQKNNASNSMPIWVYIEHTGEEVSYGTDYLLQIGRKLSKQTGSSLTAVIIGYRLHSVVNYISKCQVDKVLVVDHETLEGGGEQELAEAMTFLMEKEAPQIILFGSTAHGRSLAPRLAAKLRAGLTADCLDIKLGMKNQILMTRPAYSGRILAEIVSETYPVITTLRLQKADPHLLTASHNHIIPVLRFESAFPNAKFRCISQVKLEYDPPSQEDCPIVFGIGAGIGRRENLQLFDTLCELLNANIVASREAVARGWMEPQTQIGISGHCIAPAVYVACGISGSVQHLLGIQEAQYIIAINNNIEAPIFNYASLGLLGDLKEILPAIIEKLQSVAIYN